MSSKWFDPLEKCGDGDGGLERGGGLVIAGRDCSTLFEPVEAAFNDVAAFVDGGVEGGRASAAWSASASVGLLVEPFGDGVGDAPPA